MFFILKRFRSVIRHHRIPLYVAVGSMILIDFIAYGIPVMIGYITDRIYPFITEPGMLRHLFWVCGLLITAGITRGVFAHLMVRSYWCFGELMVRDLRNALYGKLQHLGLQFYDRATTGDLMSRVTNDIQLLRDFFAFGLEHRLRIVLISGTVFVFMLFQEWRLAVAVYTLLPIFVWIVLSFIKRMQKAVEEKQRQMGQLNTRIQENITGIRVVKAFSMEQHEIHRFDIENKKMREKDLGVSLLQMYLHPILLITNGMGSMIILLFGGYQVINGTMSLGVLFAFISYLGILQFPVMILAANTSVVSLAVGASHRIQEILDSTDQKQQNTGSHAEKIQGRIVFQDVGFSYQPQVEVLKNVTFTIEPGERVGLFGLTGAGKSTLISLIPRFYLPTSGAISIDNQNAANWDLQCLRLQIGMVLQETFLFSATMRENIAFGKPEASLAEIQNAARHAQIHDFIETLPNGYETLIGEYGVGLSGGQRQRIAIARTLLQDPKILVLDNCTSSLDSITERKIQQQLRELMKGRTTIIIAQRLSTLSLAQRIIILDDGRIKAMGPHLQLLSENPLYKTAYEAQSHYA